MQRLKKMMKVSLIFFLLLGALQANVLNKKAKFYTSFGYNRSAYSNSDITLQGDDYKYVLSDVKASDRQTPLSITYITDITIPQFNFKIGYFIDNTQSISIGADHMKYVVDVPQKTSITGIDHQGNTHTNGTVELDNFLAFEHTDGLNYINLAYNKFFHLWVNDSKTQAFSLFAGAGAGVLIPRTNVTLIGRENRQDAFRLAGYGLDIQGGAHYDFYTNFFLRSELKSGYISMTSISTSSNPNDKAIQSFTFLEYSLSLGYMF
jgi:hypothetical protein